MKKLAFTLIETLVVVGIIAVLSTIVIIPLLGARDKARDTKRKSDLNQIGRFFSTSCFEPTGGEGTYDLAIIINEIKSRNPQYSNYIPKIKDPKSGTDESSNYFYIYGPNKKCALYANLENNNEPITLNIAAPTPGGGNGVLRGETTGVNETKIYFQVTN